MCQSQSARFWYSPRGNESYDWIRNLMSERVTLLCWLCQALGHTFIVEQPGSAKFGDMPRWKHFTKQVCVVIWAALGGKRIFWKCRCVWICAHTWSWDVLGVSQVFRQKLWMRHYGVLSWKSTCLFSNSSHIARLDLGPLTKEMKSGWEALAHTYRDGKGRKRCSGKKKQLKQSQKLSSNWMVCGVWNQAFKKSKHVWCCCSCF